MQIHFLGLQRPFGAIAHSPQGPKDQNENVNHCDSSEGDETFLAKCFAQITKSSRRHVHHFLATAPEKQSRDQHRDPRNSKCPPRSVLRIAEKPGTKKRRNEGAGVNREIEPAKHFRQQMFVRIAKLIANVCRHAWFNAACPQTNQKQSDRQHRSLANRNPPGSGHAREREIAQAVDDREREDGPIFAQPAVGDDRAENREKVNAENEVMRVHVRLVRTHRRKHTGLIQNVMRHENGQDRLHAVIRETLGSFVADDVRYARRHAR
jgi:hypothetical protein